MAERPSFRNGDFVPSPGPRPARCESPRRTGQLPSRWATSIAKRFSPANQVWLATLDSENPDVRFDERGRKCGFARGAVGHLHRGNALGRPENCYYHVAKSRTPLLDSTRTDVITIAENDLDRLPQAFGRPDSQASTGLSCVRRKNGDTELRWRN